MLLTHLNFGFREEAHIDLKKACMELAANFPFIDTLLRTFITIPELECIRQDFLPTKDPTFLSITSKI